MENSVHSYSYFSQNLSAANIQVPTLLSLIKLSASHRHQSKYQMDLESGGAAVHDTQYELDMHQMIFLNVMQGIQNLPKDMRTKPHVIPGALFNEVQHAHFKFMIKNIFASVTEAAKDLNVWIYVFKFIPWIQAIGDAMDQFLDLAQGISLLERTAETFKRAREGVKVEDAANVVFETYLGGSSNHITKEELTLIFDQMASDIPSNPAFADGAADGKRIFVCDFVRAYLMEREFFAEEVPSKSSSQIYSSDKLEKLGDFYTNLVGIVDTRGSPMSFLPATQIKSISRYAWVLLKLVKVSDYLEENVQMLAHEEDDAWSIELNPCEATIFDALMLHSSPKWNEVWRIFIDLFFSPLHTEARQINFANFGR
jgi:hypothetical protein